MHTEQSMTVAPPVDPEPGDFDTLSASHPGLARFADAMRRNHPGISDQEIAELFDAWTR